MPHTSKNGNKCVVVMMEHFTKGVELVPILEKSSFYTAAALKGGLVQFEAPAAVQTDPRRRISRRFCSTSAKSVN
jgi:hypothetical protein